MNVLDLVYALGAVVLAPVWMRKARGGWSERFGKIAPLPAKTPQRPRILLHAVSVGEVGTLRGLVPLLQAGDAAVVVSAGTDTGLSRARELFGMTAAVVRYPLDFSSAVERFLDAVQPDAVALVELEVWPNFVAACKKRGTPVVVINGRLSARSFRGYQRIKRWMGRSFASLACAAVQDDTYAERFKAMGVPADRVVVTDSMKWDAAKIEDGVPGDEHKLGADGLARALGIDRDKPLVVAGSTGPGEEALLQTAVPPGVQLLCAPRKPERFQEALAAMPGCTWRRGEQRGGRYQTLMLRGEQGTHRFLLATIGELRAAYALADVVVMGRSFGKLYGSDPVEPVALGKATLIGPRYGDFESAVRALSSAGGLGVVEPHQLAAEIARLIADPAARAEMARRGRACILAHQGATKRHAQLLLNLVNPPQRAPLRPAHPAPPAAALDPAAAAPGA